MIAIVSDSTAGLSPDYVAKHDIIVVPLYIKMGVRVLREGVELSSADFYAQLPHINPLPTTSQPSVGDLAAAYQAAIDRGATSILSVHLSQGISGTVNSANLAAQQFPQVRIDVVDSGCAVAVNVMAVQAGVAVRDAGGSHDEVLARMNAVIDAHRTIFVVDTLEYLYKGGRIGGAAALAGSLLQMKPLLVFQEGKINALRKVRGSSRAISQMIDILVEWLGSTEPLRTIVMQADCLERSEQVLEQLREKLNIVSGEIVVLSPVIGTHVGPGTIGVCCCPMSICGVPEDQ
ncbi:MAG: DegV family protein [Chloroflexi bacterium]|nr:DegV family protein [Chloroflexota bacterium]